MWPSGFKIYLAIGYTDLRKSFGGLSSIVSEQMDLNPLDGNLFAFCNRSKTLIKIIFWDQNGFCIWMKRLEKGRFRWPETSQDVLKIQLRELQWLMSGLSIEQKNAHKPLFFNFKN